MNLARRILPWLGRFVLLAAVVIFTLIGTRNLADPVRAAGAFQTSFGSAAGATSFRVGFGAFPLAFAAILAACLLSSRRRWFGLGMVATVMGLATGARLLGIALDGPAVESSRLLVPEIAMTGLALLCTVFEWSVRGEAPARAREDAMHAPSPVGSGATRLRRRIGSVLVVGIASLLALSAIAKLAGVPAVVAELGSFGFTRLLPLVGVLELASAALVAFPISRRAGLHLASAFLGGAVATHLQHGLSPLAPAVPLALLWLGAWLARPELAALAQHERAPARSGVRREFAGPASRHPQDTSPRPSHPTLEPRPLPQGDPR